MYRNNNILNELPEPLAGKTGWPWDEASRIGESVIENIDVLPKMTIVTPSYNQGEFLEETIRSVLLQNYLNLEYTIIDGGSTDNSVEIIKKYEPWIDYWVSETDQGQSHAINKGFKRATGQWGNWINSDDMLAKDALLNMSPHIINADPHTLFIGQCILTDKYRTKETINISSIQNFNQLINIRKYWRNREGRDSIAQQNVLFNIDSYKEVGGLNEENHYTMDFELWGELLLNGVQIQYVNFPVGIFRHYAGQKISFEYKTTRSLLKAVKKLVLKNKRWSRGKKIKQYFSLLLYQCRFNYGHIRSLIGVKRCIRNLRTKSFLFFL